MQLFSLLYRLRALLSCRGVLLMDMLRPIIRLTLRATALNAHSRAS